MVFQYQPVAIKGLLTNIFTALMQYILPHLWKVLKMTGNRQHFVCIKVCILILTVIGELDVISRYIRALIKFIICLRKTLALLSEGSFPSWNKFHLWLKEKTETSQFNHLFLPNFIPTLYPESFMLCKKVECNDLSLEVYNSFDIQLWWT